ncbi:MAG: hypothetical protein AB1505_02845 [Candidatus Latescibacterota bacterium]
MPGVPGAAPRRVTQRSRLARWGVAALVLMAEAAAAPEASFTARGYDERIQHGIDLIYSLRFPEAERYFGEIARAEPDNPVGYFFLAMVEWWHVLLDLEDRSHDEPFYARVEKCIGVCDRRLEKDPMDYDAILFKGGSIGFRGRLRGDRNQYLQAATDGLKVLPLLEKSRQLEPTNRDILFGLGIYNYFAEVMPQRHPVIRPVMVFLPDGDREQGLEQLRQAATEGKYTRAEAAYFLSQIHRTFEGDHRAALEYLEYLHRRYPDNALFHRYRARSLVEVGRWAEAVALYGDYNERSQRRLTGYHVHGRLEALYYLGKHAFYQHRLGAAGDAFAAVDSLGAATTRERDKSFVAMANLMLGMTRDLEGKRHQATERYERVLRLTPNDDARDLARRLLREPYQGSP